MTSRPRLPLVLCLACLPVAAIAAPLVLTHPETAQTKLPADTLFAQLPPAERQVSCQRQLERTVSEADSTRRDLQDIKARLDRANADKRELPVRVAEISSSVKFLEEELVGLRMERDQAAEKLEQTKASAVKQREAEEHRVVDAQTAELANAVEQIDEARRQRDAERKRIGALPSTQDEATHSRQQKKRAQAEADLRLVSRLSAAQERCERLIAAARDKVQRVDQTLSARQTQLTDSQRALAVETARLEQLPEYLAELRERMSATETKLAGLLDAREHHEQAFALARIAVEDLRQRESETARQAEIAKPSEVNSTQTTRMYDRQSTATRSTDSVPVVVASLPRGYSTPRIRTPRMPSASSGTGYHSVTGHVRRNGSYVQPHYRTNPDGKFSNNWSSVGNTNPFTGKAGTRSYPSAPRYNP